jgi:uncharacterized membrane protein
MVDFSYMCKDQGHSVMEVKGLGLICIRCNARLNKKDVEPEDYIA